jgi:hypothetical protein
MRNLLFIILVFAVTGSLFAQDAERFREGYIIDKFGEKYSGLIKLEPGDGKKSSQLIFKESKKGKKETYGPDYVRAFVAESDSFTILKNIPFAHRKAIALDFVKVELVTPGGVLYLAETEVMKSAGHATTEFKVQEEKSKYIMSLNGKLVALTANNMKDFATIVADHADLKARILGRKVKFQNLNAAITEYKEFKKSQPRQ